jgi:hypothetical protein
VPLFSREKAGQEPNHPITEKSSNCTLSPFSVTYYNETPETKYFIKKRDLFSS